MKHNSWQAVGCNVRQRLVTMIIALALIGAARAGNNTWNGNGADANWATVTNWVGNVAPGTTSNLYFGGTTRLNNTNNLAAATQFNSLVFNSGAGAFILNGNAIKLGGSLTNSSANLQTISFQMAMQQATVINALSGSLLLGDTLSGAFALTKEGTNTLSFTGTNTYTGATTVNAGTVTFGNTSSNTIGAVTVGGAAANTVVNFYGPTSLGANTLVVGNATNSHSVVNITNDVRLAQIKAGVNDNLNAAGAVFQTGGSVAASVAPLSLGEGIGSYGYYGLAGGTLQTTTSGDVNIATKGHGVLEITGGMLVLSNALFLAKGGAAGVAGTLNIFGGALNGSAVSDNYFTMGGTAANSFGQLNVGGSGVFNIAGGPAKNRALSLMYADYNTNVVNLLTGGTIIANRVTANVATGQSIFNFNGGTLTTTNSSIVGSTFLQGLTAAYVYPAGAVIDTASLNLTVAQPLWVPTGYGVTNLALTSNGSGYIGAPAVVILGGSGMGATAIAQVDLRVSGPTAGQVTNLLVTCPGSGYQTGDTLTVSLRGGGYLTPAGATAALGANASTGGLTKNGAATLTPMGANTYGGLTTINAGALNVQQVNALGSTAAGTVVASGATLQLQGNLTLAGEALLLNGTGVGDGGALRNLSGTNVFTGAISLGSATRINVDADALTLNSSTPVSGSQNLTFGGAGNVAVATALQTGTGTLTKDGAGTLTLTGASTFSGKTALQNGTLKAASVNSVSGGTGSSSLGAPVTVANGTIDLGAGTAAVQLIYTGTGENSDRVLNLAGTTGGVTVDHSGTGLLKFTSALTATGSGNKTLTLQGSTAGGGELAGAIPNSASATALTKSGAGTWTLSAANTFTGATAVNGGTLALSGADGAIASSASVSLTNGATLLLNNTAAANNANRLNDAAAITMNGGALAFSNDSGAASFSETAGALSINQSANTVAAGQAAGGQTSILTFASLARTAGASVNFSGPALGTDPRNAIFFTVAPTLTNGLLGTWATINGSDWATYDAVKGVTTLDAGSYTDIAATGSTISDSAASAVRITTAGSGGNIALGANPTTVNTLLQNSTTAATVDTAAKTLRSAGIMIGSGQAALTLGAAVNDGTLMAASAGGELTLVNQSGNDLTVNAVIADNGSASALVKAGVGRVILTATNSYSGVTRVNEGALNIQSSNALGTVSAGTTVAVGAALQLQGGITTLAEPLMLSGTGVSSDGALRNISANNTFAGLVTLGSDTRINSDTAGQTLTLSNAGTITGSGFGLTVGGVGNTAISGIIGTGTGTVTKDGTGTLTLSGANTFSGTLAVREGVLYTPTIQNVSTPGTVGNSPYPVILGSAGKSATIRYPGGNGSASKPFTMETGGTGVVDVTSAGTTLTLSGIFDGYGALTKVGPGALLLFGANTFSGPLAVQEGKLSIGSINNAGASGVLGRNTDAVTLGSSGKTVTLSYTGSNASSNRKFALATGSAEVFDVTTAGAALTLSDTIDGAAPLTKTSAGVLTLSGANTYSGISTVSANGGTLHFAKTASLYNNTPASWTEANLVVNTNGTLCFGVGGAGDFAASDIDSLAALGSATGGFKSGSNLGIDTTDGNFTYDSVIANPNVGANVRGFVKLGANQLTLTAAQSYTGPTYVKNGTLAFSNVTGQAVSGNVTIGDGVTSSAFLALGANDQLNPASLLTFTGTSGKYAYLHLQGKRQTLNNFVETTPSYSVIQTRDSVGTYGASTIAFNVGPGTQSFQGYFRDTSSGHDAANTLALVKNGAGTLLFGKGGALAAGSSSSAATSHNYSGGTVISNGVLVLTSTNALPALGVGNIVLDGGDTFAGSLDLNGFSHTVAGLSGVLGTLAGRIFNNAVNSNATLIVGNNNATVSYAGTILNNTGTGSTLALVKAGTGMQTLSGTNTYSGGTIISNGTLMANNPVSLPSYDVAGKVIVTSSGTVGVRTGDGTIGWNASQIDNLRTNAPFTANTTGFAFDTTLGDFTYPGSITQAISLVKMGVNALSLSGASTNIVNTTVNSGTLIYATNASMAKLLGGSGIGTAGAIIQNGGDLVVGSGLGGADVLSLGLGGGYGYYRMNGGTLLTGQLAPTGNATGTNNAVFDLCSGAASVNGSWLVFGWQGGNGLINLFGGSLTALTSNDPTMGFAASRNTFSMINVLSPGAVLNSAGNNTSRGMQMAANAGNLAGVINLNGGTFIANRIYAGNTGTPSWLGFNGGTLKANPATTYATSFLQGLTAATIYPGGATIDTTNNTITVNQAMVSPAGFGLAGFNLVSGGAGYIGAPTVLVSGGSGTGATAIAQVDLNTASPTYGQVTGLQVTSAGFGYQAGDTLTASLGGGGCTVPASFACVLGANGNYGGLTKQGIGTLILGGTNTYGGVTTISNGILRLGRVNALPTNAAVTVAGGLYDLNGFSITNGAVTVTSGAISNGTLTASSLTVSDAAVIRAALTGSGGLTKSGNGTLVLNRSASGLTGPITVNSGTLKLVPAPIEAGLAYWLDATDASRITLAGSNVTTWADSSPAGVDFTQAVASQRPVYVTNAINGLPAVRFNGTTNKLAATKTATCQTVFIVNTVKGYVDFDGIWGKDSTVNIRLSSANSWYYPGNGNDFAYNGGQMYVNGVSNSLFTASTPHLLSVISATPRTSITTALGSFTTTGPNRWFNGDIGEVLVYNSALSTNDRQRVEAYLSAKWLGTTNNVLPAGGAVTVAAGATLDLSGQTQTFAGVSGSGQVSNGTLNVTGTIAPGGTNVVGTLTLGPLVSQSATLLTDVAVDGTSDLLAVQGDLNLSSLQLQVANPDQLNRARDYTIASCTGTPGGAFSATNLTGGWHIRLNTVTRTVHLVYPQGTFIMLR